MSRLSKYRRAVLIGLASGLSIYLCLTRWYAPPLALSHSFNARFEWDSARGFRSFKFEDTSAGERVTGSLWQKLVASQIKPRLESYLKKGHFQNVRGSAEIEVVNFIPVALPGAWGSGGLDLEDLDRTPLMSAAAKGDADAVRRLVSAGAEVNAKDYSGRTPLLLEFDGERTSIVVIRGLLAAGADVNARDLDGYTPLLSAIITAPERERLAIVRELLAAHANVNATNKYGATALIAAAELRDSAAVAVLLAAGADVNAKDNYGTTALSWQNARAIWKSSDFSRPQVRVSNSV